MAAEPLAFPYAAPYIRFFSPAGGGVRIRVVNSAGGVEYECDLNAATWTAITTAMGVASSTYIPSNHNSFKGDGSLNYGGNIGRDWLGAA